MQVWQPCLVRDAGQCRFPAPRAWPSVSIHKWEQIDACVVLLFRGACAIPPYACVRTRQVQANSLDMTDASRMEGGGPSKAWGDIAPSEPITQPGKQPFAAPRRMSRVGSNLPFGAKLQPPMVQRLQEPRTALPVCCEAPQTVSKTIRAKGILPRYPEPAANAPRWG